jgi:hypothetical protein
VERILAKIEKKIIPAYLTKTKMNRSGKKQSNKDEVTFESRHQRISFKRYLEEIKTNFIDDEIDDLENLSDDETVIEV